MLTSCFYNEAMIRILTSLLFLGFPSYGEENRVGKEVSSKRILIIRIQENFLKKVQVEDIPSSKENRPFESVIKVKGPRLEDLSPKRRELAIEEEVEEALEEEEEKEEVKKKTFIERQILTKLSYSKKIEKYQQKNSNVQFFNNEEEVTIEDFIKNLLIYELVRHVNKHYSEQIERFLEEHPYVERFLETFTITEDSIIINLYEKEF